MFSKTGKSSANPFQPVAFGFAGIILLGAVLLMMPFSAEKKINFLDAVFTSTSAVCVTGLAVTDTGTSFTAAGQCIILLLIQIGGLGFMTISSFIILAFKKNTSLGIINMLSAALNLEYRGIIKKAIFNIVQFTLTVELAGTFLLYLFFRTDYTGKGS
ncbi:MAG TPA: hypothetical protein DC049_11685, partial [Spirochaetia bacterium]|nr:hypothetical protein [Spirochaetia bacterium]